MINNYILLFEMTGCTVINKKISLKNTTTIVLHAPFRLQWIGGNASFYHSVKFVKNVELEKGWGKILQVNLN